MRRPKPDFNNLFHALACRKYLEINPQMWDRCIVTIAIADDRRRVRIPGVKAGEKFSVENNGQGTIILHLVKPVEPRPAKVRLLRRGKYTVMVTGRPVTREEIQKEIDEWP